MVLVEFEDVGADTVEEIAVVGNQQQRDTRLAQVLLQPDDHVEVKVVGRLIQHEEVRLLRQHLRQRDTLLLTARALLERLAVDVGNAELGEELGVQEVGCLRLADAGKSLRQVAYLQVVAEGDFAFVVVGLAGDDIQ